MTRRDGEQEKQQQSSSSEETQQQQRCTNRAFPHRGGLASSDASFTGSRASKRQSARARRWQHAAAGRERWAVNRRQWAIGGQWVAGSTQASAAPGARRDKLNHSVELSAVTSAGRDAAAVTMAVTSPCPPGLPGQSCTNPAVARTARVPPVPAHRPTAAAGDKMSKCASLAGRDPVPRHRLLGPAAGWPS